MKPILTILLSMLLAASAFAQGMISGQGKVRRPVAGAASPYWTDPMLSSLLLGVKWTTNANGNVLDLSTNAWPLTNMPTAATGPVISFNGSMNIATLDGSQTYVNAGDRDEFTMAGSGSNTATCLMFAWVKITKTPGATWQCAFTKENGPSPEYLFRASDVNTLKLQLEELYWTASVAFSTYSNKWMFMGGFATNGIQGAYTNAHWITLFYSIEGGPLVSYRDWEPPGVIANTAYPLRLGSDYGDLLGGSLGAFRIYKNFTTNIDLGVVSNYMNNCSPTNYMIAPGP